MKYTSKKDPTVTAQLNTMSEKYGTVSMTYLSGPNEGKSFDITTSTLKRWWKADNSVSSVLDIDEEKVNTPYKPDVTPHYIPKPQSVIEYEKKQKVFHNSDLPEFEAIVDTLGSLCTKVNENSKYIKFSDKSTLWRKERRIDIYAAESLWEKLANAGLQSSANKDKDRPFAFKIETQEQYDIVVTTLKEEN